MTREMKIRTAFAALEGYLECLNTDKAAVTVNKAYVERLHSHYMRQLKEACEL